LRTSFWRFAHPVGQQVSAAAQTRPAQVQAPLVQVSPGGQVRPQTPQFIGSLRRSTQELPLQQTRGAAQSVPPQVHVPVDEQPLPGQQSASLVEPAAQAAPPLQLQLPSTHISPGLHSLRQVPQLKASVLRSTQPSPGQQVCPAPQPEPLPHWQTPPAHCSSAPQALPQRPQFRASERTRTQAPSQQSSFGPHAAPPQR
jgi:hypothetical protein